MPYPRMFSRAALRQARLDAALTQWDLAVAARVTLSCISDLETGRKGPSVTTLVGIADALAVPLDALFEREPITAA
jgi:DNA-binding XRE family transcriptional regulator